jgi:carbonic anhydrase
VTIDDLVANNAGSPAPPPLPAPPRLAVAVLTCMDARIDPVAALGLQPGDAHVLRNAGGVATDDTIRSLVVSQRMLGTREVMVVHHTGCGMEGMDGAALAGRLEAETGRRPAFSFGEFAQVDADVAHTVGVLRASGFLVADTVIRGFVYDLGTGRLREVPLD